MVNGLLKLIEVITNSLLKFQVVDLTELGLLEKMVKVLKTTLFQFWNKALNIRLVAHSPARSEQPRGHAAQHKPAKEVYEDGKDAPKTRPIAYLRFLGRFCFAFFTEQSVVPV